MQSNQDGAALDKIRTRVLAVLQVDRDGGGIGLRTWQIRGVMSSRDKRYLRGALEGLVRDGLVTAQPIVYQRLSGVIWAAAPIAPGSQ